MCPEEQKTNLSLWLLTAGPPRLSGISYGDVVGHPSVCRPFLRCLLGSPIPASLAPGSLSLIVPVRKQGVKELCVSKAGGDPLHCHMRLHRGLLRKGQSVCPTKTLLLIPFLWRSRFTAIPKVL